MLGSCCQVVADSFKVIFYLTGLTGFYRIIFTTKIQKIFLFATDTHRLTQTITDRLDR